MYISNANGRYNRDGEQIAGPGDFLILMTGEGKDCQKVKAMVRSVRLHQCGHWMMGRIKIDGYTMSLSGSYGHDGLICTVPDDIYRRCGLDLPQELYDAWAKGDGWNSAGSEAPCLRSWALANLKALKARPAKWGITHDGSPCLDGLDTDDLKRLYSDVWNRPKSLGREWYGPVADAEKAANTVRQCAYWMLEARQHRLDGRIEHALYVENSLLEREYASLPEYAKW
jgi:hypothetical protein